jgi:hypothetical protein
MKIRSLVLATVFFVFSSTPLLLAESVRFAVVGDTQGNSNNTSLVSDAAFSKIVQYILAADPAVNFVVLTGDLVLGSPNGQQRVKELQYWKTLAEPWYASNFLGLKVYPTPGNHDQVDSRNYLDTWQAVFPELPDNGPNNSKKMNYSFDFGACHFIILNTSNPNIFYRHTVDTEWLENDLQANIQPVVFVFGHEPAYPAKRHIGKSLDARPTKRDVFWQILRDYGVKIYFCGHEHIYDHWINEGVHQIVTGSGGVPSSDIIYLIIDVDDNNKIFVSIYDGENNSLIEQFDLADSANVSCEKRIAPETNYVYNFFDNSPCMLFLVILIALFYAGYFSITNFSNTRLESIP